MYAARAILSVADPKRNDQTKTPARRLGAPHGLVQHSSEGGRSLISLRFRAKRWQILAKRKNDILISGWEDSSASRKNSIAFSS